MGRMTRRCREEGFTLVELTIALVLGLVVIFALGRILLSNQRAWEMGRDKAVLQQNATEALEWMARSIRAARTVAVTDTSEIETYDEHGDLVHTYRLVSESGEMRLQEDGTSLIDRHCTRFRVTPNSDTTSVTLSLELEDNAGEGVESLTRVTVRNRSFKF